jgi:antitoxin ParD1/3/4
MRTNIDIDDDLMAKAMTAGPYQTKKDAVEAGLKLLARQAAYREIMKWRGKLKWEGDESVDWTQPAYPHEAAPSQALMVAEPQTRYELEAPVRVARAAAARTAPAKKAAAPKRHAGR